MTGAWLAAPILIGIEALGTKSAGTGRAAALLEAFDARVQIEVLGYPKTSNLNCDVAFQKLIGSGDLHDISPFQEKGDWTPAGGAFWIWGTSFWQQFKVVRMERITVLQRALSPFEQSALTACLIGSPAKAICADAVQRVLVDNEVPITPFLYGFDKVRPDIIARDRRRVTWTDKNVCVYIAGLEAEKSAGVLNARP